MALQRLNFLQLANGRVRCDLEYEDADNSVSAVVGQNAGKDLISLEIEPRQGKGPKITFRLPPQALEHAAKLPPALGLALVFEVDPLLGNIPKLSKSNFIIRCSCVEVDEEQSVE